MIYQAISSNPQLSVRRAAKLLSVSPSRYHKWASRTRNTNLQNKNEHVLSEIRNIIGTFSRYGYRRVERELRRRGFEVNHKRVRRIMKTHRLLVRRKRTFPKTTDSNRHHKKYPNLIQDIDITGVNQIWASDITYIQLAKDYVYLAVVLDHYGRRCISSALERYLDSRLTLEALNHALETRVGADLTNLIHHSDQGVQYASNEYTKILQDHGIRISMSRTGNPYDNAYVESFFKTLKVEEVYMNEYETFNDALENITTFIEDVYNTKRLHSSLVYKTPVEFEKEETLYGIA